MAGDERSVIRGVIRAVTYQNMENGYAVVRMGCADGQEITVVGTIPMPTVGERLEVTGRWSVHPNYGRQLEAEFLDRFLPETGDEIRLYLSGRVLKGIGPRMAARIVQKFGEHTLEIFQRDPERLAEVSGISAEKARELGEEFRQRFGIRQIMEFFAQHQLPAELAVRVYKLYGADAVDMLYDDPYLLMDNGLDAPFGAVDRFAVELGVAADDPRRTEAGALFEMKFGAAAGHVFVPEEKLVAAAAQLLSVETDTIRQAVARLLAAERLVRQTLAGIAVLYLPALYAAETTCADRLLAFGKTKFPKPDRLDAMLGRAARESDVTYSAQQEQAIRAAAVSGALLVTGGPGTGKTTILSGVLSVLGQMGLKCVLCAPTGRAAKRLTEVTGEEASTIHRLLEAGVDPNTGNLFFAKDADNPLKADAVIVDETSMVDVQLLASLLDAIPQGKRLILVGDPDQLPPVGPGLPFRDMLRSGALPCVRLTEIFRQAQKSLIVMNAHRINSGTLPELRDRRHDFFFLPCKSEQEAAQTIVDLCSTRLPKNMHIPAAQIQTLTPTRRGGMGTAALNKRLQSALNPAVPGKREHAYGDILFREGDRVMQIRNNYDILWKKTDGSAIGSGIFNGDVGTVREIDPESERMMVVFDDREADYDFTQLGELEPAYAMTVHKSQGSEYRAVVLSVWGGSPYLLSRSVLYTAVTRARELLILVGREETVRTMTQNGTVGRRYSGLKLRLQEKA